jgi:hypothetical protein
MKKIIITVMTFAFAANVSAQLEVDAAGNTHVAGGIYLESNANIIAAPGNVPITFKVNGVLAGSTGNSVNNNVSFGYRALSSNTTGYDNTANGADALSLNTTGYANTANGYEALSSNKTGSYNTANGVSALYSNTTGIFNTANGVSALYSNTTGNVNTANGVYALTSNKTGSYNTAIGYYALYSNTTGNYNTAIGYNANVNAANRSNATAIGYDALATSSNQVRIGNSSVTSIGGYAAWTNLSDKRTKKNIRTDVPGLAFINRLQPVTFNLDLDAIDGLLKIDKTKRRGRGEPDQFLSPELIEINKKAREAKEKVIQTGFVAQEVEKIAQSIGYDFSGVDVDEIGIYGLRYAEFVVPLVKAVQELSEQNDRRQAQNERLQAQIDELLQERAALKSGNAGESATGLQNAASSGASLQQNAPNPFSQSTQIRFYLPQNVKTASLNIYNLQGKQLKQTTITQRGEGFQPVAASEFDPGIYLYALIADGREVDVKRMILTE